MRELVSNAVDASQKLKVLAANGEYKGELGELKVEVIQDREAKTLTIRDYGIGMTEEEIDKYINQIAFSGAEEFVNQYKGKEGAEQIIGHFGLGFYSSSANMQVGNGAGLSIGSTFGTGDLNGYMQDVRVTSGYARYTGSTVGTNYFTPPTAAFPTL